LKYIPAILLLIGILTGCAAAVEGDASVTSTETGQGIEQAIESETERDLSKELDTLVAQFALEDNKAELIDLSQDERAAGFPPELVSRLQEALAAGSSDILLMELDDSALRIKREDFIYEPLEGEDLFIQDERINDFLTGQRKADSYDFYRLDIDQDGLDEIIMIERTRYEYSLSSYCAILEQNATGSYGLTGGAYLGYYRIYAIFSYEGSFYMVCNYDDYKRQTTKALGLLELSGDVRGSTWLIKQKNMYLRKNNTDCGLQKLWAAGQESENDENSSLQSAIQAYIQEIGLDVMLRNQNSGSFSGLEKKWSEEKLDKLTEALENAVWTPTHLDYATQTQRWLFELEGQQVYFTLYYNGQSMRYLLEAFLYQGDTSPITLEPIALYGIKPQSHIQIVDYWDYEDSNVKSICYKPQEPSQAFPENRQEVTEQLWKQAQAGILSSVEQDIILSENASNTSSEEGLSAQEFVPAQLIQMAKEALYTRDWSSFDELAAPLELTDHGKALEAWFSSTDSEQYICHIYQYSIGESQFLLIDADMGGSARIADVSCYRLTENGSEQVNSMTTLDMNARVVPYEGRFYLVDTSYNYYSKYRDIIILYPLTSEGISERAVWVTLAPVDYLWTNGYRSDNSVQGQIDDYVSSIQKELMAASPINDGISVFIGCEELVTDAVKLQRLSDQGDWYMVDYDNDGQLEYEHRHYWFPSNFTTLYLIREEYRLEDITWELREAWEPECPYRHDTLIQRWYQEFDGKIYTFQLFLTEGYNYYLNVSLWEKEQVSWIASYYVTPRCELQVEATGREMAGAG
ncbi:MAG: hypothetical protein NC092_09925, partial [Butyrivibrio sp.]|nr:hypothetical protein [Butyrivibrio sp.]